MADVGPLSGLENFAHALDADFIFVDLDRLQIPDSFETLDIIKDRTADWRAAWFIAKTCGVVVIPPSDFYSPANGQFRHGAFTSALK